MRLLTQSFPYQHTPTAFKRVAAKVARGFLDCTYYSCASGTILDVSEHQFTGITVGKKNSYEGFQIPVSYTKSYQANCLPSLCPTFNYV